MKATGAVIVSAIVLGGIILLAKTVETMPDRKTFQRDDGGAAVAEYVIEQTYDLATACGSVIEARKNANGSVHALCSNGESYQVGGLNGRNVALRCRAGLCLKF